VSSELYILKEETMKEPDTNATPWERNVTRNTKRLAFWTGAWVLTMALANFGPIFLWFGDKLLSFLAIALNTALGVMMILANKKHLQSLDEMQQRIQRDAMGVTLGVGLVVGLSYSNLDITGLIPGDAEISVLVIITGLTYATTTLLASRRYR
jgi:hypothetical protein